MKLHDLRPAAGSRRARTRVGRGIAAGKGKTAGRGTKGQRSRAGASIPSWFEGGQTPIHIRVPKLHGFKNRFKVEFAVVNVGAISDYAAAGRFGVEIEPEAAKTRAKAADRDVVTVNAELLASAGLVRSTDRPLKILGQGDVSQKLFVAADAFSATARRKIEDAGGFVQVLAPAKEEAEAASASEPTAVAEPAAEAPAEATAVAEPAVEANVPAAESETPELKAEEPAPTTEAAASAAPAERKPTRRRSAPKTDTESEA